ncbi:MAG TPA: glycoside hydrolase family 15 protein [Acetobacteraceae bacterium]|nr:glycoside hydrolase family 15 protein [Acetobacteraceae bacterium]
MARGRTDHAGTVSDANPRSSPDVPDRSERPPPIEDYALIGDCETAALVSKAGSIDWLCWPRFDDGACFAALLGTPRNGRWQIAPQDAPGAVHRRYRPGTLILETVFETPHGSVALLDFMVPNAHSVVRILECRSGHVAMAFDLALRFEYGSAIPWVTRLPHRNGVRAVAGRHQVVVHSDVPLHGEDMTTKARFTVRSGQRVRFVMTHAPSHIEPPEPPGPDAALQQTEAWWTAWTRRCTHQGEWREAVHSSLITLKALTYAPTGGIVAAPTTSLPEQPGGARNWDYRFCWLRDATFTLLALMHAGYREEAQAWGKWLRRTVAGTPDQVQTLYRLSGERWILESEVPWLAGYRGASPVRVGNAASTQVQLDVYGELMDALYQEVQSHLAKPSESWDLQTALIGHLEEIWDRPDESIWEVRGSPRHFTFSKAMVWVALDRAIRGAEQHGLKAPLERWRALRDHVHAQVCDQGFNAAKNSFVQYYGADELDASLLLLPLVGFLPPHDPRIKGTVAAIERELMVDGLVRRYNTRASIDGLQGDEGVFLACSFWFVDNLVLQDRRDEARAMFERLLALRNDVGLLAEEYDPVANCQLGNFPQAFSHLALVNAALNLENSHGPAQKRRRRDHPPG